MSFEKILMYLTIDNIIPVAFELELHLPKYFQNYSWQFAPGSFVTALYRNQLLNLDTEARDSYTQSIYTLFKQPISNVFSLKLHYFLDYNQISGLFKS